MKTNSITILLFILVLALPSGIYAQEVENEYQSRLLFNASFKPIKKLKITISPEFRFNEDFSVDKYLLESEVEYKLSKWLKLGARYGFITNIRKEKDTEYLNRYAFMAKIGTEMGRFDPSLRLMYSNYADDGVLGKKFLRYKLGVKYDIPNCKITPNMAIQPFQDLTEGGLYKTRYSVGADIKLFKKNFLGINYKFDYYNNEYLNGHIISLGYSIKF